MYLLKSLLYALFVLYVKCQISSETSDNEITAVEISSNDDEPSSTNVGITENNETKEFIEVFTSESSVLNDNDTEYETTEEIIISTETSYDSTRVENAPAETEPTITTEVSSSSVPLEIISKVPVSTTITPSANSSSTIIISLPTFTPYMSTDKTTSTTTSMCQENEVYSCLPLCPRTCNNPMSRIICRPVPSYISICRRGCTCQMGYLLEKTIGKCVKECPAKQPL